MNSYRMFNDYYGLFFIAFNLIVAYFFMNIFTGIMFKYFNEAYRREQQISKNDKKAPKYYDFLIQILESKNNYIIWNKPMKGTIKYYLRNIVDSEIFENGIMIIIFLNMIFMLLTYDGCHENLTNVLRIINYLFTSIFIAECVLKLFAYGIKAYFYVSWNKFDFFIIVISIIDWIVAGIDGIDAAFLKSFQIIRVLKVLRVSRVIRLVKALKGLEKILQIVQWSFSALINVISLIFIFYCIFALIGCYLYDGEKQQEHTDNFTYINEYYNMNNFYSSYLLIFRCATGENWPNIMMEMSFRDYGRGEGYSFAFFILSNFFTAIILLNLLLMVILQTYDEFNDKKYNPIDKFKSFLSEFNNAWNKFSTEEDEGFRIKNILVAQFFMNFNWKKLNFPEKGKLQEIKRYVNDLKLINDSEDYVYYHDMIFKILYKQMGSQIDRTNKENNLIFRKEKELQKKIKVIINEYISKKKGQNNQKNILTTFNPFASHLLYKQSFFYMKSIMNIYKETANTEYIRHNGESSSQLDEKFFLGEDLENSSSQGNENSNSNSNSGSNDSSNINSDSNNSNTKNDISRNSIKETNKNNNLYSKIKEENSNSISNSSYKINNININKENGIEDELIEISNNKDNDIKNENEELNNKVKQDNKDNNGKNNNQ